jgi:hypothetical protein
MIKQGKRSVQYRSVRLSIETIKSLIDSYYLIGSKKKWIASEK